MYERKIDLTIIRRVLPDYACISEAPTLGMLAERAEAAKIPVETLISSESQREYKSIESISGDIYLIQNPVAWKVHHSNGVSTYHRPKPKLLMRYAEAVADQKEQKTNAPMSTGWNL